jgi:hypothetical protein
MASLAASAATALSAATFAVMASSAAFTAAVSSAVLISATFSTAATAAETSHAIRVDPPSGVDVTTLEPGYGAVAALGVCCPDSEGSLTVDPPLWNCLILLCRVTSTSDDSSASLSTI